MFLANGKLPKLGKRPVLIDRRKDRRVLHLRDYLPAPEAEALPPAPSEVSWITKLTAAEEIPMYLNDVIGCCVEAAAGHMLQAWNFYAGHPWKPTDNDILKAYEDVSGYIPGDPSTDVGTNMLDFLWYWQRVGVGGHRIIAFMSVDWNDDNAVRYAIQTFGNVMPGYALPLNVQGASDWTVGDGGIYTPDGAPGSWGGHAAPGAARSPITTTCETWGIGEFKMSNNFWLNYVDECWVVLCNDWLDTNQLSPDKINLGSLQNDLKAKGFHDPLPVL